MKPVAREIEIIEFDGTSRRFVPAIITRDVNHEVIDHVEIQWAEPRRQLESWEIQEGLAIEHAHWDWNLKASEMSSDERLVAISCAGMVQGMMAVRDDPRGKQFQNRGTGLYVDYLETAPWNIRLFPGKLKYAAIGTLLIAEAMQMSMEFSRGGICLHSLPRAASFYRDVIGMTDRGPDSSYYGLPYFEYNEADAVAWLHARKSP